MQPGRKLKREWMAAQVMVSPTAQNLQASDITAPAIQPCDIARPAAQETDVTVPSIPHHALPGPSDTQLQSEFGDVSLNFISRYFFNLIKYNVLLLNHNKCMHSTCQIKLAKPKRHYILLIISSKIFAI
jgi:hypothetical protein